MIKELELACQYKVFLNTKSSVYSFTTKNDIEYEVIFTEAIEYFQGTSTVCDLKEVFSLTIEKITDVIEPIDMEVQSTIDCILCHFFENTERSLIYTCDTSDGKGQKRYKKFSKWYSDSVSNSYLSKIDVPLNDKDGVTHYTSLIYHNDNPFQTSLMTAHYEVIEVLSDKD